MEVRDIEFQFKGTRTYIHGTDIFTAMVSSCPTAGMTNIRFSVHEFIDTPTCRLYLASSKEALKELENISARCALQVAGAARWLALTPGSGDSRSASRYMYDESRVISLCRMEHEGITLAQSPFSFIETVVAMTKHMHQQLFPLVVGKWVFTRIDLTAFSAARENLSLTFKHNMNFHLTRSDIMVNGLKVGDIFFSLVNT